MCLAVPGELLEIIGHDLLTRQGRVAFAGVVKNINLALLPDAQVGDYILVHAGFAIAIVDESSAQKSLDYLESMGTMIEESEN
jgi:hydrogenase expression/formation protein HypC